MPKPNLDLEMIGVPPGATLSFWNQPNITCVVVSQSPPRVAYGKDVISLTEAVRRATKSNGVFQGPAYWKYDDELLTERRKRFEQYHCYSNTQPE